MCDVIDWTERTAMLYCEEKNDLSLSYLVIVVSLDFCLVVRVHVQVALQRPQVLVAVAGSGDDLEADVAQGVEDDDARALQSDPVGRVPPGLLFHSFRKFALKF